MNLMCCGKPVQAYRVNYKWGGFEIGHRCVGGCERVRIPVETPGSNSGYRVEVRRIWDALRASGELAEADYQENVRLHRANSEAFRKEWGI